jgi:hypothetical protein
MLKIHDRVPETKMMRRALLIAVLAAVLCWPAGALADTAASANWAGYAVHKSGVSFRSVTATWRQPNASCVRGSPSYSAFWIGLGGFSPSSTALEQTGTEVDCSPSGKVVSSAWYELVPSPSRTIRLTVHPGDEVSASVSVASRRVTISLYDATRHKGFHKVLTARAIDISSAEWIVEAPSQCAGLNRCQTLPLANFRTATFASAHVRAINGHHGSISNGSWDLTKIKLIPGGRLFVVYGPSASGGSANPSALRSDGSSFRVTYSRISRLGRSLLLARDAALRAGYIVH